MSDVLVPLAVFVVGPLVSGAIVLIARLTHSGLRPTTAEHLTGGGRPGARRGPVDASGTAHRAVGLGIPDQRRTTAEPGGAPAGAGHRTVTPSRGRRSAAPSLPRTEISCG